MSRTERLLDLLQVLRRHRHPIAGTALADEMGVSLRTLYRDIATLRGQGARIEGEPGIGYLLRPGFTLPPLMFSIEELEALVLGSRWVAQRSDDRALAAAARDALAKIAAVLPDELRREVDGATLLVGPAAPHVDTVDAALVREAIRRERKLVIAYRDAAGQRTRRTVWPFALGFFERARVVVAWCETRAGFRHFRLDRVGALEVIAARYPRGRAALLAEWRQHEANAAAKN
ncbi:MAG TPA: YafY family protein [Polyangia bacterium]|nr:YafY family protein [Polyangia bacterium]